MTPHDQDAPYPHAARDPQWQLAVPVPNEHTLESMLFQAGYAKGLADGRLPAPRPRAFLRGAALGAAATCLMWFGVGTLLTPSTAPSSTTASTPTPTPTPTPTTTPTTSSPMMANPSSANPAMVESTSPAAAPLKEWANERDREPRQNLVEGAVPIENPYLVRESREWIAPALNRVVKHQWEQKRLQAKSHWVSVSRPEGISNASNLNSKPQENGRLRMHPSDDWSIGL